MMNLQIAKWGNSLAVRIPADYVRKIGMKEGDHLVAQVGADMVTLDAVLAKNAKRHKLRPVAV